MIAIVLVTALFMIIMAAYRSRPNLPKTPGMTTTVMYVLNGNSSNATQQIVQVSRKQHRRILNQLEKLEIDLARRYNLILGGAYNMPRYSKATMAQTCNFGLNFAIYYLLRILETLDQTLAQAPELQQQAEKGEVIYQFAKMHRNYCSVAGLNDIVAKYTAQSWKKSLEIHDLFQNYFTQADNMIKIYYNAK